MTLCVQEQQQQKKRLKKPICKDPLLNRANKHILTKGEDKVPFHALKKLRLEGN